MPQTRRGRKQGTKMSLSSGSDREKQEIESSERQTSLNSPTNDFTYNFCKPPLPGTTTSNHPSEDWNNEADAYDINELRPKSVSLSSQLLCLRELTQTQGKERKCPASGRKMHQVPLFSVELPRPGRLHELLDVYFRDLDSFFPFIKRDGTQAQIEKILQSLGHSENQLIVDVKLGDHSIIALLCNMLAIAESFCAARSWSYEIRPGWSLFLRGRKLIQHCSPLKHIDIHLIQYHALSSEYLMESELLHEASRAISNAAQLAMRTRLNEERVWNALPESEIQNRKRLWWTIYFLDRKISQRTGSPYVIRETEIALSEFSQNPTTRTDRYMQVLVDLGKLWSLIWDTFFAAVALKPQDWKEVEIMDTRILIVQRELAGELTWDTDLLKRVYLAEQESEPYIRRRLAIFIRLNLLRLTIRQNPIQKRQDTRGHSICVSLASKTVYAIAAFTDSCPSVIPCGFFFSTALLECIYHLILAMRAKLTEKEHNASIKSFQLAYQLLDRFSQALDTAKRALRALNSVVSLAAITNSHSVEELSPDPGREEGRAIDLSSCVPETIDFFDPMSWQIDDIPLDVVALVSSMGEMGDHDVNDAVADEMSEQSMAPDLCLWNCEYGIDPTSINL
ncbi:unnamed protein product [Penicillium manginii]